MRINKKYIVNQNINKDHLMFNHKLLNIAMHFIYYISIIYTNEILKYNIQ